MKIMSNVNRLDNMEKELVERVFVYDRQGEKAPIGIVKINANIAGDIYSDEDLDDDGYVLLGITRLVDGRYVELYRCLGDYGVRGFLISEGGFGYGYLFKRQKSRRIYGCY